MGMRTRDSETTKDHINRIKSLMTYFDEIVIVTPKKLHKLYDISAARGDSRLYLHGIEEIEKD